MEIVNKIKKMASGELRKLSGLSGLKTRLKEKDNIEGEKRLLHARIKEADATAHAKVIKALGIDENKYKSPRDITGSEDFYDVYSELYSEERNNELRSQNQSNNNHLSSRQRSIEDPEKFNWLVRNGMATEEAAKLAVKPKPVSSSSRANAIKKIAEIKGRNKKATTLKSKSNAAANQKIIDDLAHNKALEGNGFDRYYTSADLQLAEWQLKIDPTNLEKRNKLDQIKKSLSNAAVNQKIIDDLPHNKALEGNGFDHYYTSADLQLAEWQLKIDPTNQEKRDKFNKIKEALS